MLDGLPHFPHPLDGDLAAGTLPLQHKTLGVLLFEDGLGVGTALGVEVVGGQTPGGKPGAAARLADEQHRMRQPAGAQRGAQLGFEGGIAGQTVQHHSFSNRSTLVTMTVAPPTVTSMGMALSMPRPRVAVPGTISVR